MRAVLVNASLSDAPRFQGRLIAIARPTKWIAMCLSLAGLASFGQENPPSRGRDVTKLYVQYCASCHGVDMAGGSASSLVDGIWRYGGDDASVADSIRNGHSEAGMPAMANDFDAPEIRGLVIYIREREASFKTAHTKYNAPVPGAIVPSENASFKLQPVIESGLEVPWAIAFLPDGRMLVTERPGRLRILEKGKLLPESVRGTPAVYGGEGGLLDVALHPDYSRPGNDWIYLSYGDKSPGGLAMTAVIRGHLRDGALVDQQQIFKADDSLYRPGGQRFGSRLLFDSHGHLLFSVGDRACPGDEQDLSQPNGKVHRVNDDGSIPKDNPFVNKAGAIASIWTYGNRNPQGLTFSPVTGELWESEHGPRGGDELNILHAGHNYGWPVITYGMNYDGTPITDHLVRDGMDQPVTYWVPSIATSPLTFYTGNRIPQWKNNLFLGALAAQELLRLVVEGGKVIHQEVLFKGIGRVRDIVNGPDGYLYVVLNAPDRIERLVPADAY
ncbi:MAG TPA: PQQ-dependent sugar dehydrogenase [Bryobacteraceae bacterium]|nr:PQQ-dependent sugar dehydrogenase [Bryobacteraceae bacterium]